jgi:hypothetical protein
MLCRWGGKKTVREARGLEFDSTDCRGWLYLPIIFLTLQIIPVGKPDLQEVSQPELMLCSLPLFTKRIRFRRELLFFI